MAQASASRRPTRRKPKTPSLDDEIAHLRSLDQTGLQARWQSMMGRRAPPHLPKHLLFGILAYRVQADELGDIDAATVQLLKRAAAVRSPDEIQPLVAKMDQRKQDVLPGTVLTREWNGQQHRVMVVDGGFAFEGKTFISLSKIAFAITGTNWNGPRFFGLRPAIGVRSRA
jgi:hypothetical protein